MEAGLFSVIETKAGLPAMAIADVLAAIPFC
jgi:hypothetical protein